MVETKAARLKEFVNRMHARPPAGNAESAVALVCTVLNEVEDEFSGVPYDPDAWLTDGRMYGPKNDNVFDVEGRPDVQRYRTRGHNVFVAANGAIRIEGSSASARIVVLDRPGQDGRRVFE